MKAIYTLLILLIPFVGFGQSQDYNITYQKKKTMAEQIQEGYMRGLAIKEARLKEEKAREEALKDKYSEIKIDLLINNSSKYSTVLVNEVTGWMPKDNRKTIVNKLKSEYNRNVINLEYPNKTHDELPDDLYADEVLVLDFQREKISEYSRRTILTITDGESNILYKAVHKNIPHSEMLYPLSKNYVMTKKMAKEKIMEYKELLDLGIITNDEYNNATSEYKSILLDN